MSFINVDQNYRNKIFHYSLKEYIIIGKIARFDGEMF